MADICNTNYINPLTVTFFSVTRSPRMKIKMLYNQLYYNTEWYINIVLTTNNMLSMSKMTIYIYEAILKYIYFMVFMISSSIPFTIMHKLLDVSCYNIAHNVFICTVYILQTYISYKYIYHNLG